MGWRAYWHFWPDAIRLTGENNVFAGPAIPNNTSAGVCEVAVGGR